MVIADLRKTPDQFPMSEQTDYTETNYILIDLAKPVADSERREPRGMSRRQFLSAASAVAAVTTAVAAP